MNTNTNTHSNKMDYPTCASCDHLSFAGHYCHNWQCQAELTSSCAQHSKIKPAARRYPYRPER